MLTFINNLVDKCVFTLLFICGVQLPAFIGQYLHQLSGQLTEAKLQLAQYETLAAKHYQGELSLLIKNYRANNDPVIVDTASVIEVLVRRVNYLDEHFTSIYNSQYLEQLLYFFMNLDLQIAQQTANLFQLSVPLEWNALITGFAIAFGSSLFKQSTVFTIKYCKNKMYSKNTIDCV